MQSYAIYFNYANVFVNSLSGLVILYVVASGDYRLPPISCFAPGGANYPRWLLAKPEGCWMLARVG